MLNEIKADLLKINPNRNLFLSFLVQFLAPTPFKAVLFYRLSHYFFLKNLNFLSVLFETFIKWRYASDIRRTAVIGGGLTLPHPYGIVIGGDVIIGDSCHIGQHVTIGGNMGKTIHKRSQPIIGNNCFICANSVVVGPIEIGENTIIGAGSVVVSSIPSNVVAAGNPCKIIRQK